MAQHTANPARIYLRVDGQYIVLYRSQVSALRRFDTDGVLPSSDAHASRATIPGRLLHHGWARHSNGRVVLTDEGHKVHTALLAYLERKAAALTRGQP
jgi:hypothetical protein